jgi:selenocysteine lyase/cysteine desulfurase
LNPDNQQLDALLRRAPHEEVVMGSADDDDDDYYDAVVMSPHKLVGGPGTPGILLMRRSLYGLGHIAPSMAGGGTVSYVNGHKEEVYLHTLWSR